MKPALGPAALAPDARVPSREPGIVSVEGRAHSVAIHYLSKPAPDYVKAAVAAALDVHRGEAPGDVLIFLTGEDEIEEACEMLREAWARESAGSKSDRSEPRSLPSGAAESRSDGSNKNRSVRPRALSVTLCTRVCRRRRRRRRSRPRRDTRAKWWSPRTSPRPR